MINLIDNIKKTEESIRRGSIVMNAITKVRFMVITKTSSLGEDICYQLLRLEDSSLAGKLIENEYESITDLILNHNLVLVSNNIELSYK